MLKKLFWMALAAVSIFGVYCITLSGDKEPADILSLGSSISFEDSVSDNGEETAEEPLSEIELLMREQEGQYAYTLLPKDEQRMYAEILKVLREYGTEYTLSTTNTERIADVFQCVLNDHPELFYVEGYVFTQYTKGDEVVEIRFSGTYNMPIEEIAGMQTAIKQYVETFRQGLWENMSEYDKVKYVYEYVINHTEYNMEAKYNQSICSVFLNGESVCQGYAKAVQYLLDGLSVQNTLVIGTVNNGEGHAWNLVKVDGSYYYVDATWGDASYQASGVSSTESISRKPSINYDFLCVTTQQLEKTHTIQNTVPMPRCVDTTSNYYQKENCYFTVYDKEHLRQVFDTAYSKNAEQVSFRCGDKDVYDEMKNDLIYQQGIFEYMDSGDGIVAYSCDDVQYSMCFWIAEE